MSVVLKASTAVASSLDLKRLAGKRSARAKTRTRRALKERGASKKRETVKRSRSAR